MKKIHFLFIILATLVSACAIFFVLRSEKALVVQPKGLIAHQQLHLMVRQILLMLIVIVPTFIAMYVVAWKYRAKKERKKESSENSGTLLQLVFWGIPSVVVAVMSWVTWGATHALDPYKPLESEMEPLKIQVIALDWKWLFIYPKQGIAAVNFVHVPEKKPVHFELAADGSPMNSFWVPQLSGQIYAMSGMVTSLHMMAYAPGTYTGRAAEINGEGYAAMTFVVQSSSQEDFERWVEKVKQSPLKLTDAAYTELIQPSQNNPVTLYSSVEKDLFHNAVMKYMHEKI